ncbi:MAG: 4-phosphoerythronate dehydrogenase [Pseudomonadota bacterium]
MKAIADENIAGLAGTFGRHLDLRLRPGRALTAGDLDDAEVLLVRSVTRVDKTLLRGSRVRFVGTATIGTDHLDTDWLDKAGIRWAAAPGCNADAAAQYTLAMILLACRRLGRDPHAQRLGIIGHGNVGSRLRSLAETLGLDVVVHDPPLASAGALPEIPREEALACDVVSLHVPLTYDGPWPTAGMIDASALSSMPRGALLVNSARGGVLVEADLQRALDDQAIHAALDVWPQEPAIAQQLLEATTVANPHVAGYSVQGKERGTRMIFEAFLDWSGQAPKPGLGDVTAANQAAQPRLQLPTGLEDRVALSVISASKVEADDQRLRQAPILDSASFDGLRRAHTPRHEFSRIWVTAPEPDASLLRALGFRVHVA